MSEKTAKQRDAENPYPRTYKRFGTKQVLAGVDLDVPRGTSLVVIGGSGSGKSVLLKCVLGLLEPDDGMIEIDGRDLLKLSREERERARTRIGMLFQAGALFDSLPVWENVAFGLIARHKATRADGSRPGRPFSAAGRPGRKRRGPVAGRTLGRHAEARRSGPSDRLAAGYHVLR